MGDQAASFVGGMNVPAPLGRFNATVPLAKLAIDSQRICLRARWNAWGSMGHFDAPLDQVDAAFPLLGTLMTPGVGIRRRDGLIAYFWTYTQRDAVLSVLNQRGVRIEAPQRARAITGLRDGEGNPVLPTMPTVMQVLAPVVALLGTAAAMVLLIAAPSSQARVAGLVVWVASAAIATFLWWRGKQGSRRAGISPEVPH